MLEMKSVKHFELKSGQEIALTHACTYAKKNPFHSEHIFKIFLHLCRTFNCLVFEAVEPQWSYFINTSNYNDSGDDSDSNDNDDGDDDTSMKDDDDDSDAD
jgi:hypothetical protein